MDNALEFGTEDCRFVSCHGRKWHFNIISYYSSQIFIFIIFLLEGRAGEACKPCKKVMFFFHSHINFPLPYCFLAFHFLLTLYLYTRFFLVCIILPVLLRKQDFWWTKWYWDRFISQYLGGFLISIIPPIAPYLSLFRIHVTFTRRTNGRSLGTFQKSTAVSEIGEHCIEIYFQFFLL
jgi:hypothetical protein